MSIAANDLSGHVWILICDSASTSMPDMPPFSEYWFSCRLIAVAFAEIAASRSAFYTVILFVRFLASQKSINRCIPAKR